MITIRSCIDRDEYIATGIAVSLEGELLPPHHGNQQRCWRWWWRSMEMAPGALPRPGRVPEQTLSVPRISPSVAAALWNFSWLSGRLFRVSESEASYRRRRQGRWRARGP